MYFELPHMRIWSIHPKYLDQVGLVALWRETLLGKAALIRGRGGYYNHPQLERFKSMDDPIFYINLYLRYVYDEAKRRGYNFDINKIDHISFDRKDKINVTEGQIRYEFEHLKKKLEIRNKNWLRKIENIKEIEPNPVFIVVPGPIENWEKIKL